MTYADESNSQDPKDASTLSLDIPCWVLAAQNEDTPVKQWAVNTLNAAAASNPQPRELLDGIDFHTLSDGQSPFPFQVCAIRHWIGLTQTKAAGLIDTRLSTYRNCESIDECVLMDVDRWSGYVEKAVSRLSNIEYDTLPNAFGRAMRGLSGLTYRELNDISDLSQSYWTTRLRFKHPPAPIEIDSIDELIEIVITVVDDKFNKGLFFEAKAILKSLLFFAFETQKARAALNPLLISPMHILKSPADTQNTSAEQHLHSKAYKKKPRLIETANLYARTVDILSLKGYFFSDNHVSTCFTIV